VSHAKSKLAPHVFVADPDMPARYDDTGRLLSPGVCATCHLPGAKGDAHHTMPDAVEDVRQRAAGEREAP
jgi:mono/diheme cytochrome c family protein